MMDQSKTLESINETVEGLHKAGVMDLKTLQEFKKLCLHPSSTQKDQQAIASKADQNTKINSLIADLYKSNKSMANLIIHHPEKALLKP